MLTRVRWESCGFAYLADLAMPLKPLSPDPKTTVNPIKLETGLRPNSAGIPYTFLLAIGLPTFRLLL